MLASGAHVGMTGKLAKGQEALEALAMFEAVEQDEQAGG